MPRLELTARDRYAFRTGITVRTTDLNYGGHLGNDRLLALIHEARVAWLASHDLSELDCGGVSLILADAAVIYRAEAYAGDELEIEVAPDEVSGAGFRLFFRVTRPADGAQVALVENGMVCFDYHEHSIRKVPPTVRELLEREATE